MLNIFLSWAKKKFLLHSQEKPHIYLHQYEVWLVSLGINIGSEINKMRPVIIMANETLLAMNAVLVAPISSNVNSVKSGEFVLESKKSGLNKPSICLLHQMRCVDKKRFVKKLGKLTKEEIQLLQLKCRDIFII